MIRKVVIVVAVLLLLNCGSTFATPAWYLGTINRVWPSSQDGGFIITFSTPSSLNDCKHTYAYFKSEYVQSDLMKNAFSVALSAFHSGSTVGVVIDKGPAGDYCYATTIDLRK